MRLTIVHPAIGHRKNERYIRSWQMEPLPSAVIAGLTPDDVEIAFYDDRVERIDYDHPSDAVAISLEAYTAKRAYQIASEYRKRGVPVIFGGFHATLVPEEAARFAESVVTGEAEYVWPELIDDLRHGTLKKRYDGICQGNGACPPYRVDRSVFRGKNYLPVNLLETGRGCRHGCEFCSIQSFFRQTRSCRHSDQVLEEIAALRDNARLFFFVDDNFAGDIVHSKALLRALPALNIRWVTQISIDAAHDEEYLFLLAKAGCMGVLIGFESLEAKNIETMNKRFNMSNGGYERAMKNLRKYNIRVYATFVFGYDHDTPETFAKALDFALDQGFYIAAFNHLTPFPGTPLYSRLQREKRLKYDAWWLDDRYRYNDVPFYPARMTPEEISEHCLEVRRKFYSWRGVAKRAFSPVNRSDPRMFWSFFIINAMQGRDGVKRHAYPLGDENWNGSYLETGN